MCYHSITKFLYNNESGKINLVLKGTLSNIWSSDVE